MNDIDTIIRSIDYGIPTSTLTAGEDLVTDTYYDCSNCGSRYQELWEADNCCTGRKVEEFTGIRCYDCEKVYDKPEDASNCCNPSVAVTIYYCPNRDCECAHDNPIDARGCCA